MPNTAEWPIVLLGAMEAGLIITTANPVYIAGKYTDLYTWYKLAMLPLIRGGITN
jgi:acyl-CoA synthetase (AMP-forming)/AMP-acid ligase II